MLKKTGPREQKETSSQPLPHSNGLYSHQAIKPQASNMVKKVRVKVP